MENFSLEKGWHIKDNSSEEMKQEYDGSSAIVYHPFTTLEELNALEEMMINRGVMGKVRIPIEFMPNLGSVCVDKIEFEKKFPLIEISSGLEAIKNIKAQVEEFY